MKPILIQILLSYIAILGYSYLFLKSKFSDIWVYASSFLGLLSLTLFVVMNVPDVLGVGSTIQYALWLYKGLYAANNVLYSLIIPALCIYFFKKWRRKKC